MLARHSMAGMVISRVAGRMPARIASLLYISAYLLEDGQSIVKASELASDLLVTPNRVPAPDWSTISFKAEGLKDVFAAARAIPLGGALRDAPDFPCSSARLWSRDRFSIHAPGSGQIEGRAS